MLLLLVSFPSTVLRSILSLIPRSSIFIETHKIYEIRYCTKPLDAYLHNFKKVLRSLWERLEIVSRRVPLCKLMDHQNTTEKVIDNNESVESVSSILPLSFAFHNDSEEGVSVSFVWASMDRWMDGWMERWMERWMDERILTMISYSIRHDGRNSLSEKNLFNNDD